VLKLVGVTIAALAAAVPLAAPAVPAVDVLEVRVGRRWQQWWRNDAAPERWSTAHPAVAGAVRWRAAAPGVEWGELMVSGAGEAWRIRVVLVRVDTARVRLRTRTGHGPDGVPAPWTIDSAPATALVAVNAGQFDATGPWGWVVEDGVEHRAPGRGPLAPALVVDGAGALRWVTPDSVGDVRDAASDPSDATATVRAAFQSYPTLLDADGAVPAAVRTAGLGVDHEHRDARVAIGLDREGRVIIALTRFAALGEALSRLPFGLTTPEMAALMGALGCDRAVLLDGGASSQLMVRDRGRTRTWPGIRRVPVGLVVEAR
jgi:uncharacterized protein YigE (DUF2233 family)